MSLPQPKGEAAVLDLAEGAGGRRVGKSAAAFRTISEVATDLEVPPHVLRFWESKFPQIKPLKRGGGRRYYRPEDIELLRRIRVLLYRDGYTIKGVQKLLRGSSARGAAEDEVPAAPPPPAAEVRAPAAPAVMPQPAPAPVASAPVPAAAARPALDPAKRAAIEAAITALEQIRDDLLGIS